MADTKGCTDMFKICYVLYKGSHIAGAEQSLLNLIREIAKRDVKITAVCETYWPEIEGDLRELEVKFDVIRGVRPLRRIEESQKIVSFVKGIIKKIIIKVSIPYAIWYLRKNKVDIVHANTSYVSPALLYASKILRIPYVYHIREFLDRDVQFQ